MKALKKKLKKKHINKICKKAPDKQPSGLECVFICRGSDCRKKCDHALSAKQLKELGDALGVPCRATGCLDFCEKAPVAYLQKDDDWQAFAKVKAVEHIEQLLSQTGK